MVRDEADVSLKQKHTASFIKLREDSCGPLATYPEHYICIYLKSGVYNTF